MSNLAEIAAFRRRLVEIFDEFERYETFLRIEYERETSATTTTVVTDPKRILERPTRRFLVDRILAALGWNPEDPGAVMEEARATGEKGNRLYFDYLGLAPMTRFPVAIVESKAVDLPLPEGGSGRVPDAREVVRLVVDELEAIKSNGTIKTERKGELPVRWTEWLRDLARYVAALSGQTTLSRVVLTAGRWFVVFRDPLSAFGLGRVRSEDISCFTSFDDMVARHTDLFYLLDRGRVVEGLPLSIDVSEALSMLHGPTITECYRAVAVATTTSGASRRPYPTRSVYPAIVVVLTNRCFAVVDWSSASEEPRDSVSEAAYVDFVHEIEARSNILLERLSSGLGLPELRASPLAKFRGLPLATSRVNEIGPLAPAISLSSQDLANPPRRRRVVPIADGVRGGSEFLVVTGTDRFYKTIVPYGPKCGFHQWKAARTIGKASPLPLLEPSATSFTVDGQVRHCAHGDLHAIRRRRCHVDVLESHVCCRACVFYDDCWSSDSGRLPCPASSLPTV